MSGEKEGFFKRLVSGLTKTRDSFISGMDSVFRGFSNIDEDFYEELEETLIMGDIGVRTTEEILEHLREQVKVGRKRKYSLDDLKNFWKSPETICQTQ